jgi:tetrahydromethanopterin S-methyltransferase subunit E
MITNTFIYSVFIFGTMFSIESFLFDKILSISGVSRGNLGILVFCAFLLAVIRQLDYINHPFNPLDLLIPLLGTLAANRSDLTNTIRKGRWWWKEEKKH